MQIVSRVRSVIFEVASTAMHCLVFHESARTHPVDQLQIVAVDPGYLRLIAVPAPVTHRDGAY